MGVSGAGSFLSSASKFSTIGLKNALNVGFRWKIQNESEKMKRVRMVIPECLP